MAIPVTGSFMCGEIKNTEPIIEIFKKTGARAGAAKWPRTLRIPIERATIPIKKIYGNMRRVRKMVMDNFAGSSVKPGAMIRMMSGDKIIPAMATTTRRTDSSLTADLAISKASSFPWFVSVSVNTGINATLKEPSAKSLLKRFGILKATKNASELKPAPKNQAMTTSLTNPKIRLNSVADPTTPAAFVTRSFSLWVCFFERSMV